MNIIIGNIQPGNKALEYIERRIRDDNYRGAESSEHNRYDMQEIFTILQILNKYAPDKQLMRIRDTDLSKRPQNTSDEMHYAHFCGEVKEKVGKGTQDSIRKNIFVDMHRMGLIERYDDSRNKTSPYGGGAVKYVSLSNDGVEFVSSNLLNRAFLFTKALDKLLGGYIEISLEILKDSDYDIEKITKWDFMFFVSAIDVTYSFRLSTAQCAELIKEFHRLSPIQQRAVVESLKKALQPKNFFGDKTAKRDWHNWQNKIDQVFHLFKQTPYFDVSGKENEILTLSTQKIITKDGTKVDIKKRSIGEKYAYFSNHHVQKTDGYELHHVVPLSWSESPEQFKLFDRWQNMVYIDAYSHAKITQNRNRNIYMYSTSNNDLILFDKQNNQVYLTKDRCVLYDEKNKVVMLDYNKQLLTTV